MNDVSEPADPVRVGFRRPPFWTFAFVASSLTGALLTMVVSLFAYQVLGLLSPAEVFIPPLGLLVVGAGWRVWLWRRGVPDAEFYADHLRAPRHSESVATTVVPYDSIVSLELHGFPPNDRLLLGTQGPIVALSRRAFALPDGLDKFVAELHRRVTNLRAGGLVIEAMAERRRLAAKLLSTQPKATSLMLVTMGIVLAICFLFGAYDSPLGLVRFGAAGGPWVRQGDVFRIWSSLFIHSGLEHLYLNGLALFFLGTLCERLLGTPRFVIVAVGAGVLGSTVRVMWPERLVIDGLDPLVWGVLGAVVLLQRYYRSELPAGFRQPLRFWLAMVVLLMASFLVGPQGAVLGQATGLVAGVVLTALVMEPSLLRGVAAPAPLQWTAGLMAGLCMTGVLFGLSSGFTKGDPEVRLSQAVADDARVGARELNELAWRTALWPEAGERNLTTAESSVNKALRLLDESVSDQNPQQGWWRPALERALDSRALRRSVEDTHAAVLFRLGRFEEALYLQRRLLGEASVLEAQEYANHFGDMLKAAGGDAKRVVKNGLAINRDAQGQVRLDAQHLSVPLAGGVVAWLLVSRADEDIGVVEVVFPTGTSQPITAVPLDSAIVGKLEGAQTQMRPLWVGACAPACAKASAHFWPVRHQRGERLPPPIK